MLCCVAAAQGRQWARQVCRPHFNQPFQAAPRVRTRTVRVHASRASNTPAPEPHKYKPCTAPPAALEPSPEFLVLLDRLQGRRSMDDLPRHFGGLTERQVGRMQLLACFAAVIGAAVQTAAHLLL